MARHVTLQERRSPTRYVKVKKQKPNRVLLRFSVGRSIWIKIEQARLEAGVTKNTWVTEAIEARLTEPGPIYALTSAEEIASYPVLIILRVTEFMKELVKETCKERKISLTTWLTDACLNRLEEERDNG